MKRAIKISIAALTFVLALGVGLVAPSSAELFRTNLNPNHCQADVPPNPDNCIFLAAPNATQELWLHVKSGTATATVTCNGNVPPDGTLVGLAPGLYSVTFATNGGLCVLSLVGTGEAVAWTWL